MVFSKFCRGVESDWELNVYYVYNNGIFIGKKEKNFKVFLIYVIEY